VQQSDDAGATKKSGENPALALGVAKRRRRGDASAVSQVARVTQRPSQVPEGAELDLGAQQWVWCQRDLAGELHGPLRVFRADGAPLLELEYVRGLRHGAFRRFHGSGRLAEVGRYFEDLRDGLLTSFADGESSGSIRECCLPEATRVLKQEYRRGTLLVEAFFTAAGDRVYEAEPIAPDWPQPLRERADDVLLTPYEFWPALEPLPAERDFDDDPGACVEQTLEALQQAIRRAAQRVALYREALLSVAPELAPPDVSGLIGDQPPPLRHLTLSSAADELPIEVDERPHLAGGPRELALEARLAWSGLCWLCWAAGADELAVPSVWRSRAELHARLQAVSGRIGVLRHHAPELDAGTHFHGLDERVLPASALSQLARHYAEARAMLLFVSDRECVSPWQDDLGR
jgi:hypothetical protein